MLDDAKAAPTRLAPIPTGRVLKTHVAPYVAVLPETLSRLAKR